MSDAPRDTIFALSSGRPPAAIAVIRISGPMAASALKAVIGRVPEPRKGAFARIRDPKTGELIDEALALWFPGPNSETGEDTAELQLHGGRAVIAATLAALSAIDGLRPAEAGEFTRRAFENGKLDLTAVEGLADLVMAETEAQRRQAFRQMKGLLGERAESWRQKLIETLALVEAGIDFSDEGDVPANLIAPALAAARSLAEEITGALADAGRGERLREGLVVAIAGPPNAGKSTLLNRIARREAAIVSPYAGTTRDVIEVHLDLNGYPVTLLDTAGIRESQDSVEQEGVKRARERARAADLVLWVVDASESGSVNHDFGHEQAVWRVINKIDLVSGKNESNVTYNDKNGGKFSPNKALSNVANKWLTNRNEPTFDSNEQVFSLSALGGAGFDVLLAALGAQAEAWLSGEPALVTRERHRRALEATVRALERASSKDVAGREDLVAEELRSAAHALGKLTGRVDVEDILDVIFRDFCVGK
ncbi:MAG: tRNA uridine-5-carboxymethylaminomethyl(34) synthesis GTPase MnmE [Pseudolabrys sp.]